ncbi:hypothetical protein HYE67_004014 [Fusarium culmorum]|uniref:Uncharacterized protein n=1 Tax=Fusarium culmorum TaxID=5516 RepID=A0A2T4GR02_FUSCU|nr:hypothetical protein FCULG_00001196 [Fusarium culmorum]QPC61783.1 hypothetical protein HYE67_004014 [Fusarium culmorum]
MNRILLSYLTTSQFAHDEIFRSSSKEKATEESPKFSYRAFSDFGTSPTQIPRQTREDSDFWMERRMSFPIREPSLTIREKETGFHDDKLAKSQGNYRQPSLRRGSGIAYQTPEVFSRVTGNQNA